MIRTLGKFKTLAVAGLLFFAAVSGAQAAMCSNDAVTINKIDNNAFGPVNASGCEDYAGNIGSGSVLINGLNNGTFFSGSFANGTTWTFVGKDETAANTGASVEAEVGLQSGDWLANFTPNTEQCDRRAQGHSERRAVPVQGPFDHRVVVRRHVRHDESRADRRRFRWWRRLVEPVSRRSVRGQRERSTATAGSSCTGEPAVVAGWIGWAFPSETPGKPERLNEVS